MCQSRVTGCSETDCRPLRGKGRMELTLEGNYTTFTPQTDPHRKALDSNMGTKKTATKRASDQVLTV